MIIEIYEYDGEIEWDTSGPAGQYRKPSCSKKLLQLGWTKENYTDLYSSLEKVCNWFEQNYYCARGVKG